MLGLSSGDWDGWVRLTLTISTETVAEVKVRSLTQREGMQIAKGKEEVSRVSFHRWFSCLWAGI